MNVSSNIYLVKLPVHGSHNLALGPILLKIHNLDIYIFIMVRQRLLLASIYVQGPMV
jgi:hypothetical protein